METNEDKNPPQNIKCGNLLCRLGQHKDKKIIEKFYFTTAEYDYVLKCERCGRRKAIISYGWDAVEQEIDKTDEFNVWIQFAFRVVSNPFFIFFLVSYLVLHLMGF